MYTVLIAAFLFSPTTKLCNYQVRVFRSGVPTCTYQELGRISAHGLSKKDLYTDIQSKVCAIGGHAILVKSETRGSTGQGISGVAVRCNVPFLLPSDFAPRR